MSWGRKVVGNAANMLKMWINSASKKTFSAAAVSVVLAATLAGCSSDSYEYSSSDDTLPTFLTSQPAARTVSEPKNLKCETNLIEAQHNTYSGNTIIDSETVDVAVVAANFEEADDPGDSDSLAFWIAPDTPDEPGGGLDSDYWVEMHVETESGRIFSYSYTGHRDYLAEVEIDGKTSDASDGLSFLSGSSSGYHSYPVPPGFAKIDDPLKLVTISYDGKSLARCTPAEGSPGTAEPDYQTPTPSTPTPLSSGNPTYAKYVEDLTAAGVDFRPGESGSFSSDKRLCERLTEGAVDTYTLATNERLAAGSSDNNAQRIEVMVPILCPENQPLVDEAKSGNVIQKRVHDGNFLVAQMREVNGPMTIQPGVWRTKESPVSDCYYERSDGAGNIIENNFVNFAQSLTVAIAPSDGTFVSNRCGGWERVE